MDLCEVLGFVRRSINISRRLVPRHLLSTCHYRSSVALLSRNDYNHIPSNSITRTSNHLRLPAERLWFGCSQQLYIHGRVVWVQARAHIGQQSKSANPLRRENIWTIPNVLTCCRIMLTPALGALILNGEFYYAAGLSVLAGLTDMIDGQIARRWPSQRTKFGTVLDPLADKFLISTLTITLTIVELIPVWLTVLIISRDLLLIGASFYLRYISLTHPITLKRFFDVTNATMEFKPTFISKVNTVVQMSLLFVTLAAPLFNAVDHPALHLLRYATGLTTVVSAMSYMVSKDTYHIYKPRSKPGSPT